mgnify:CR=1|jgi:hypothetical protein|tara:strand:- start:519 stop:1085 length:567 start_codon:yes stop_codon:yes gene_type:complete
MKRIPTKDPKGTRRRNVTIRMSDSLYERVVASATEERRSLSSEIASRLDRSYQKEQTLSEMDALVRGQIEAWNKPSNLKRPPLRDKKYLLWLRTQACVITGQYTSDDESVVAMHIGTAGRGLKSGDDEALPVCNSLHQEGHQRGEVSMLRGHAPDWLIRAMARAYAREMYNEYLGESECLPIRMAPPP